MKGFINDIWWILLLRGLGLLLFGVVAVVWPGVTLVSLATYFAILLLVSGIADMLIAIGQATHKQSWFVTLIMGILEVAVGVYFFKNPTLILTTFVGVIGFTFIVQGILSIVASIVGTTDSGVKLLEIITGILGIIAGFVILQNPITGGLAFTWILGVYGIIAGTISIASALSLRQFVGNVEDIISPRKAVNKA
jgi:uncharacterized membrane protein HdeD (DUF308 family)